MKNRKTLPALSIILLTINFFFSLSAQRTITGKITYQDGEPQIGASIWPLDADKNTIKENGQIIGTYNDYDGNYSLTIPDHARYFATGKIKVQSFICPLSNSPKIVSLKIFFLNEQTTQ